MDTVTKEKSSGENLSLLLSRYISGSGHAWSIGISGAIGEFMYDEDEEVEILSNADSHTVITSRGAMRLKLDQELRAIAFEDVSACTRSWSQNVSFCLPREQARMEKLGVLTEIGPDTASIVPQKKEMLLFDLGVNSDVLRYCIRTDKEELIRTLRQESGKSIFDAESQAGAEILRHSPARVVESAVGRIEIETRIPQKREEVHAGPHTHLLPALLNARPDSNPDIPDNYQEVFTLYPNHPVFDKYGETKHIDHGAYRDFNVLLSELGSQEYFNLKMNVMNTYKESGVTGIDIEDDNLLHKKAARIAKMQFDTLSLDQ